MGNFKDITFDDLELYSELTEGDLIEIKGGVTYLYETTNMALTQTNIWCLDDRIFDKKF